MDPMPFVQAAYGLVAVSTLLLVVAVFGRLRRARRRLDK